MSSTAATEKQKRASRVIATSLRQPSVGLERLLQSSLTADRDDSRSAFESITMKVWSEESTPAEANNGPKTHTTLLSQSDRVAFSPSPNIEPSGSRDESVHEELNNSQESIHGMGARPLGSELVARVRRLEKKERSIRRLNLMNAASASMSSKSLGGQSFAIATSSSADESTSLLREKADDNGEDNDGHDEEKNETVSEFLYDMIFGKLVSVFLVFMPFAFLAYHLEWGPLWVFWLNFLVMIPIASILGDFTEEVAAHTNQTLGGLINATFGNAVEVVVAIQALMANEIRVVQASMIGSIFSNLLLVLGCCFFFGGLKHKEQSFNSTAASANMSLLALSSVALVLPTPFAEYYDIHDDHVLTVSRIAAVFLIFMYVQLLVFQLKTHAELFEDEDDSEVARVSMKVALTGLLVTTLTITVISQYLVSSIDGFCEGSGVSRTFVGLIILPIVGNAVEHITAVTVAMKDKMDLAMGVAVGSCTQISLFVVPLTVLVGWGLDKDMTLNFPHFELVLFVLSIFTVSICIANPRSNWLEGSLLITTYLMIAVGFWFEKVVDF